METEMVETAFDLDFHPSSELIATCFIDGRIHLYRYNVETGLERTMKVRPHKESCRAIRFIKSGTVMVTGSADQCIVATDVETGRIIARVENAYGDAVNRLVNLTETTIASGDDMGCIKVWDTRHNSCCNSFDAHEEYVSDMTFVHSSMQLLGTSGDGTLSVCNLRKNKVQSQSDCYDCDLLSVVVMKNGHKVLSGTQNGDLLLYSWGHFEDCSDRFIAHPNSIQASLNLDEYTLISGCEDGVIRLVGVLPNRIIQPIAEHSDYPIEGLAFSHDTRFLGSILIQKKRFLGSISHDQMLKLWDIPFLLENWKNDSNQSRALAEADNMDVDATMTPKGFKKGKASKSASTDPPGAGFFADL